MGLVCELALRHENSVPIKYQRQPKASTSIMLLHKLSFAQVVQSYIMVVKLEPKLVQHVKLLSGTITHLLKLSMYLSFGRYTSPWGEGPSTTCLGN